MIRPKLALTLLALVLMAPMALAQTNGTAVRWYRSALIDGSTTGTFTIGTTVNEPSAERDLQAFAVSVTPVEMTNVVTGPVIAIGTNASSYNNICSAQTVGGVVNKIAYVALSSDLEAIPKNTDIKVKVNTACTGSSPTCKFIVTVAGIERVY